MVEWGKGDGIYINTAGIGIQRAVLPGKAAIREGDAVILSGSAGCHGAAVMMERAGLSGDGILRSDCQPLHVLSKAALEAGGAGIRILRDPTRGGVATTLNEFTEGMPFSIELSEEKIPVDEAVEAACELLGLDPLYCACEGRMLAVVEASAAEAVISAMRAVPGGERTARIGTVTASRPGSVVLKTVLGGSRILSKLSGQQLPRIC